MEEVSDFLLFWTKGLTVFVEIFDQLTVDTRVICVYVFLYVYGILFTTQVIIRRLFVYITVYDMYLYIDIGERFYHSVI